MHSAIYEGRVTHARRGPRRHQFAYPLHMFYVDLEADVDAEEFQPVLEELGKHTDFLKIFGAY